MSGGWGRQQQPKEWQESQTGSWADSAGQEALGSRFARPLKHTVKAAMSLEEPWNILQRLILVAC